MKAYAHDLKDFWVFIAARGLDWRAVQLDDLGEFVAWVALPPGGRDGGVAVLPSVQAHVSAVTVNRKLAALAAFYGFHARRGVDVAGLLTLGLRHQCRLGGGDRWPLAFRSTCTLPRVALE